jgi:hypothetical protein
MSAKKRGLVLVVCGMVNIVPVRGKAWNKRQKQSTKTHGTVVEFSSACVGLSLGRACDMWRPVPSLRRIISSESMAYLRPNFTAMFTVPVPIEPADGHLNYGLEIPRPPFSHPQPVGLGCSAFLGALNTRYGFT